MWNRKTQNCIRDNIEPTVQHCSEKGRIKIKNHKINEKPKLKIENQKKEDEK